MLKEIYKIKIIFKWLLNLKSNNIYLYFLYKERKIKKEIIVK